MKRITNILVVFCIFFLSACGYHNANVYSGPEKKVFLKNWKNNTNKLDLNSNIYRSLNLWFQKSQSITVTSKMEEADLLLAGEVVSVSLPSLSYSNNKASEVRVVLNVRYVIKDLASNKIFLQEPHSVWTEEYNPTQSASTSKENEALNQIVDDLSKDIYQKTLKKLNSL